MWWMFKKLEETDTTVLYAYSRENRNLDGRILVDKKTEDITLLKPSAEDAGSKYAQEIAESKAWWMIDEGYPDSRQIACG